MSYQAIIKKIKESEARTADLKSKLREVQIDLEVLAIDNKPTDQLWQMRDKLEQQVEEEAIRLKHYTEQLNEARPDQIRAEIKRLAKERSKVLSQGSKDFKKLEKLKNDYYDFDAIYRSDATRRGIIADRLANQIRALQIELDEREEADHAG